MPSPVIPPKNRTRASRLSVTRCAPMSTAIPSGLLRCKMNPRVRSAPFISGRTAALSRAPRECSPGPACRKWKPIATQNETRKREAASSAAPRRGSNKLSIATDDGAQREIPLLPRSVSEFYHALMSILRELNLPVAINTMPNELPDPIPFERDEMHRAYDPDYANRFWRVLVQADRIFKGFRSRFCGKCSPVHFFWGAPDLAVTRFSGRTAPPHPGGFPHLPDAVTREAYSQEVSSLGFWPGADVMPQAIFYSYAYPEPEGFSEAKVKPAAASYNSQFHEFILPYDAVRASKSPDDAILDFAQSTYDAASTLSNWDRGALEERKPSLHLARQHS